MTMQTASLWLRPAGLLLALAGGTAAAADAGMVITELDA
jgi:hypothetical protein